jgi:hypothetical protein
MQYVLGNMLNGGGINPDGLSLDLQFAADKTLTARRGPTPVFTRGSTGTFVGSNGLIQSSAINTPRFDHDPVTLACKGLLIEEGRTNLIPQSDNFASASWIKGGGSISSVANIEPDGSANSELFSEDGANSVHRTFQSFTGVSGTVYTLSVFLKFAGRQYVYLENRSINTNPFVVFDIQNGTVFSTIGPLTSTIQAYPNGWYRCSVTGTANLAGGNYLIGGYSGGSQSYTGLDGPAFYLYGAQVEAGSFPTSYIPTTTGTLARSADVCSITGGDFSRFYNRPEGTLFAGVTPQSVAQAAVVVGVNTANYINSHFILKTDPLTTSAGLRWVGVSFPPAVIIPSTLNAANAFAKIAYAYKSGSFATAYNNILAGTSSSTFTSINPTAMWIGVRDDGLSINGHISEVKYFKKRLPNAKIQALTV